MLPPLHRYPTSVARMYAWTPDECIPELYSDSTIFESTHTKIGMEDLLLPSWCASPEEFIKYHREMLEGEHVSDHLHQWIDLTFGFQLSGEAAVAAKNVPLRPASRQAARTWGSRGQAQMPDLAALSLGEASSLPYEYSLRRKGWVQLFTAPHPRRKYRAQPTSWTTDAKGIITPVSYTRFELSSTRPSRAHISESLFTTEKLERFPSPAALLSTALSPALSSEIETEEAEDVPFSEPATGVREPDGKSSLSTLSTSAQSPDLPKKNFENSNILNEHCLDSLFEYESLASFERTAINAEGVYATDPSLTREITRLLQQNSQIRALKVRKRNTKYHNETKAGDGTLHTRALHASKTYEEDEKQEFGNSIHDHNYFVDLASDGLGARDQRFFSEFDPYLADLFACGCIVAEVFLGHPLFTLRSMRLFQQGRYRPNLSGLPYSVRASVAALLRLSRNGKYNAAAKPRSSRDKNISIANDADVTLATPEDLTSLPMVVM